jgi:hypothetical protein
MPNWLTVYPGNEPEDRFANGQTSSGKPSGHVEVMAALDGQHDDTTNMDEDARTATSLGRRHYGHGCVSTRSSEHAVDEVKVFDASKWLKLDGWSPLGC